MDRENEWVEWIEGASRGEKYPLAKLISEVERRDSNSNRKKLFRLLDSIPPKSNTTIGITGTPGAGKSSLLGEISRKFLEIDSDIKLAIIAIDPSSSQSGGSILGDRTRLTIPARENRIFFRSQASQLELGGVNPFTFHVLRLLRYFFEFIFIETVGIGQNEIEVSKISDFSFLVLPPLGGDQIQFMKSGIMEVPDGFVINKCDEKELANRSYHMLLNSLEFLKDTLNEKPTLPPVFLTSVLNRLGIDELMKHFFSLEKKKERHREIESQIQKWILAEYGRKGMNYLSPLLQSEMERLRSLAKGGSMSYEELEEFVIGKMESIFPIH